MSNIGIIDCGMGNLTSVRSAFDRIRYECDLIEDARDISDYKRLVLPGVGAFPSMMENLYRKGFSTEIIKHINSFAKRRSAMFATWCKSGPECWLVGPPRRLCFVFTRII